MRIIVNCAMCIASYLDHYLKITSGVAEVHSADSQIRPCNIIVIIIIILVIVILILITSSPSSSSSSLSLLLTKSRAWSQVNTKQASISMFNQMVASEIISRAYCRNSNNFSSLILTINITGKKLTSRSCLFCFFCCCCLFFCLFLFLFLYLLIDWALLALKSL